MVVSWTVAEGLATLVDSNVEAMDVHLKLVDFAADDSWTTCDSRFLGAVTHTLL